MFNIFFKKMFKTSIILRYKFIYVMDKICHPGFMESPKASPAKGPRPLPEAQVGGSV